MGKSPARLVVELVMALNEYPFELLGRPDPAVTVYVIGAQFAPPKQVPMPVP